MPVAIPAKMIIKPDHLRGFGVALKGGVSGVMGAAVGALPPRFLRIDNPVPGKLADARAPLVPTVTPAARPPTRADRPFLPTLMCMPGAILICFLKPQFTIYPFSVQ